jgi:hypothetical protein
MNDYILLKERKGENEKKIKILQIEIENIENSLEKRVDEWSKYFDDITQTELKYQFIIKNTVKKLIEKSVILFMIKRI